MTKAELYHQISLLRNRLHIQHYPIESIRLCRTNGIWVDPMPMKTPGLRGMAFMGHNSSEQDIILLKESSSAKENNFNCAHELIHLTLHRNNPKKTFQCYESVRNTQNSFEEWQANEGAAELLVPYRFFIPRYVELCRKHRFDRESKVVEELADEFGVLPGVIAFRIDNLNYEIACYLAGTPLRTDSSAFHNGTEETANQGTAQETFVFIVLPLFLLHRRFAMYVAKRCITPQPLLIPQNMELVT